jgi:hypothetical protein
MLLQGCAVNGAQHFYNTNLKLRSVAGNGFWYIGFHPQRFTALTFVFRLLKLLFSFNICGHVTGSYPAFIAGFQKYTDSITITIALKGCSVINLLFRNLEELVLTFQIGAFQFTLQQLDIDIGDIYRYDVRLGELELSVLFIGVYSVPCGNYSNVNFVNFA